MFQNVMLHFMHASTQENELFLSQNKIRHTLERSSRFRETEPGRICEVIFAGMFIMSF